MRPQMAESVANERIGARRAAVASVKRGWYRGKQALQPVPATGTGFLLGASPDSGKDESCSQRFRRSWTCRHSNAPRSSAGARATPWRATSPATPRRNGATASWTDRSPPTIRWASITPGAGRTRTSSSATTPCSGSASGTRTASTARGCGSRSKSRSSLASTTSGRSRRTASIASSSCARHGSTRSPASRPSRASGSVTGWTGTAATTRTRTPTTTRSGRSSPNAIAASSSTVATTSCPGVRVAGPACRTWRSRQRATARSGTCR